ncbi:hypothetical protein AB0K18_28790 [Nonomuraea sp. NPDC049421]|uniref:MmyB family transcriptional regulator n=1 Tax=Nonomuraea sp. NPDC049421 TaxID=3155275 RepID=UPI003418CA34
MPRSGSRAQRSTTFLRSRRELVRPQDVGLEAGRRRRTPGLRREEVAHVTVRHSLRKRLNHPVMGRLELDCGSLHVPGSDQWVVFYTVARASPSYEALRLLKEPRRGYSG